MKVGRNKDMHYEGKNGRQEEQPKTETGNTGRCKSSQVPAKV